MLIFICLADIARKIFLNRFESFFFELQICFIKLSKDARIHTIFVLSHIDKLLIGLFIIIFFLESFGIGIGYLMDINHNPLSQHLETRKNRSLFCRMVLDIRKGKSEQDKSYNKFDKIFFHKNSFLLIHDRTKK